MKDRRPLLCAVAVPLVLSVALYAPRPGGVGAGAADEAGAQPPDRFDADDPEQTDVRRVRVTVTGVCSRTEARREVVAELAAGRLSLWEAAARFHVLNGRPAGYLTAPVGRFHGGESDGECLCRQVIDWTQTELNATDRRRTAVVVESLESELQQEIERRGGIPMPR